MKETTDTLEPVLFTNLTERTIMQSKPSDLMKLIDFIGCEYNLTVKYNHDFKLALKILIHSAKNN